VGQDVIAWAATCGGVPVDSLTPEQICALHAQWMEIVAHPDWSTFPAPLRCECLVRAAQIALLADDPGTAQVAWREAVAARPDNYGLRATLPEIEAVGPATPTAQVLALVGRLRDAMQRTPVARPDAQGVFGRSLDRI